VNEIAEGTEERRERVNVDLAGGPRELSFYGRQ
jgi:hypothetical protein